jgi:hypothetical protein
MISSNECTIPLTRGYTTIIDQDDFELLSIYKWRYDASRAARGGCSVAAGRITMERELLQPPVDMIVDHINGNRLDNRRCNLRIVTRQENARNRKKPCLNCSSHYTGVSKHENGNWVAYHTHNGKRFHLGSYKNEEEAARARDQFIRDNNYTMAKLNFAEDL